MLKQTALLALALAPAATGTALAQATPERAATLQQQFQGGIDAAAPNSKPADRPSVTVTPAGDHFDLKTTMGGADAPPVTSTLKEAGSGRWAVDNIVIASPSTFKYRLDDAKPGQAAPLATTTLTIGKQQANMLIDPTFATPTTASASYGNIDITSQLPSGTQLSHIDNNVGSMTVTPTGGDKVNLVMDSAAEGYSVKQDLGNGQKPTNVDVGKASVKLNLTDVSRQRASELLVALGKIDHMPAEPSAPNKPAKPRALDPAIAASLATALTDLANAGTIEERASDIRASANGLDAVIKEFVVGMTYKLDGDKLQGQLPIAIDGLTVPPLDNGPFAALVPSKVTVTPTIDSVPRDALRRFVQEAGQRRDLSKEDVQALLAGGPITAGFDNLMVNVAGSSIGGNLKLLLTSPDLYSGTGQITAENLDRLQQAIAGNPLTAQGAPLLIFLKGIGRTEQNRTVWDVVYRDKKLLVNGQDMGALMGAMGGAAAGPSASTPAPHAAPRPAPRRP